jgi:hypothetical protein
MLRSYPKRSKLWPTILTGVSLGSRQKGGFCKTPKEFAEFAWAPSDPNDKNATVDEAVEMAHSSEAESLPGYSAANCH